MLDQWLLRKMPEKTTDENSTVSCYDKHYNAYDAYQPVVVPCYQEMLDIVAATCARYLGQGEKKILDMGCGTGNASIAVLKQVQAHVFLVDGSGNMVDIAREKINSRFPGAVIGSKSADLSSEGWDSSLEGNYDAIISTLVLEHLPFDMYRATIDRCYGLLKPGGWLIAVEGYEEDGAALVEWFNEVMELGRKKLEKEMSDFVTRLRNLKEVHYYCSKSQKEAWWREAGFQDVHIIWQYLCLALMVGRKPLE
jgi:cyclopropane fatty-acyl-phospholipid synthase-like methyltransferase